MTINSFLHRFAEMSDIYISRRISFFKKSYYFVDLFLAYWIHGASISDYFAYGFYKLRHNGRLEYITYRRHKKIQDICNQPNDRTICRDKMKFNSYFKDYLGREWLNLDEVTESEFEHFCTNKSVLFCKETSGYRGIGTKKIIVKDENLGKLYQDLKSINGSHFVVEEQIKQIGVLSEFHPWSINTIRIVTLYDTVNDTVHIMSARLRMGNKKNSVDNFHFDGIGANINIETGIIDSVGYDAHNQTYLVHPITQKQIIGFQIPYWQECKAFAMAVARKIPSVRYIGWDIVMQENGHFILIEGNDNADHDFQQLHYKGLWKEYKSILKNM